MPPRSRRALLATVATGVAGSIAGCGSVLNSSPSTAAPPVHGVGGRRIFVASGVEFPNTDHVSLVNDPDDADVAVFPSGDDQITEVTVLADNMPVVVAGRDAQWTVMQACDETGRSYGFARDSWGANTRIAAAVPNDNRLDTHLFVGAELPRDLPWALGELFDPLLKDCTVPVESPSVPDDGVFVGASRIRGVNDAGGFDRWDRLYTVSGDEPTSFFLNIEATIYGGSTTGDDGAYRPEQVRLVAEFDNVVDTVGPGTTDANGLSIAHTIVSTENGGTNVDHTFTPQTAATRESFTAGTRIEIHVEDESLPFSYIGNGRFRWHDSQMLNDDTWVHHTPGNAVWHP